MRQLVVAPRLITPTEERENGGVLIEGGKILEVGSSERLASIEVDRTIRAVSGWICPGLIDLHVHGSDGHDTMDASVQAFEAMARFFAGHGVTAYLPTTVSDPKESIDRCLRAFQDFEPPAEAAQPLGVHLEGPYLNPSHRGAQDPAQLRAADPREYEGWLATGKVKLITLAPELPGAEDLIQVAHSRGVRLAAGHTGASYEQMLRAADLGLSQATHTFNGMKGFHHREPGVVGAVLTDPRIYAQLIADGIHVHPAVVRLLVRAKGCGKVILITDAIRAAGLEDGEYRLGEQLVQVEGGVARVSSGSLAGSTLTMDQAVRNMIEFAGVTLREAVGMATLAPAQALGIESRKGILAAGADADLVILDADLQVQMTMVGGEIAFRGWALRIE